jgi:iron complex outermembrane receptor protein
MVAVGHTETDRWDASATTSYLDRTAAGNIYTGKRPGDFLTPMPTLPPRYKTLADRSTGITFMNNLSFFNDKIQIYAGFHWHNIEAKNYNQRGDITQITKSSGSSPTFGIVIMPMENLSFFANHIQTFGGASRESSTLANAGELIGIAKTRQNEIGVKYLYEKLVASLSVYQIVQDAARIVDLEGKSYQIIDGENKNTGVELGIGGTVFGKLNLVGGIAYINAKQVKTDRGLNDGIRSNAIPHWSGSLAATYKFNDNFDAMARLYFVGKTPLRNETLMTPAYSVVDLGFSYTHRIKNIPVTLSFSCFNAFDKVYWKPYNNSATNGIILGLPRTFQVSLGASF